MTTAAFSGAAALAAGGVAVYSAYRAAFEESVRVSIGADLKVSGLAFGFERALNREMRRPVVRLVRVGPARIELPKALLAVSAVLKQPAKQAESPALPKRTSGVELLAYRALVERFERREEGSFVPEEHVPELPEIVVEPEPELNTQLRIPACGQTEEISEVDLDRSALVAVLSGYPLVKKAHIRPIPASAVAKVVTPRPKVVVKQVRIVPRAQPPAPVIQEKAIQVAAQLKPELKIDKPERHSLLVALGDVQGVDRLDYSALIQKLRAGKIESAESLPQVVASPPPIKEEAPPPAEPVAGLEPVKDTQRQEDPPVVVSSRASLPEYPRAAEQVQTSSHVAEVAPVPEAPAAPTAEAIQAQTPQAPAPTLTLAQLFPAPAAGPPGPPTPTPPSAPTPAPKEEEPPAPPLPEPAPTPVPEEKKMEAAQFDAGAASPAVTYGGRALQAFSGGAQAVAEAEVRILGTDLATTTDGQGRFSFDKIKVAGVLPVVIRKSGYMMRRIDLREGHGQDVELVAENSAALAGVAVGDELSAGMALVFGQLVSSGPDSTEAMRVDVVGPAAASPVYIDENGIPDRRLTMTSRRGQFMLLNVRPGAYLLTVMDAFGRERAPHLLHVGPSEGLVRKFSIGAQRWIRGRVLNAAAGAAPVDGAKVQLLGSEKTAHTDRQGRFTLGPVYVDCSGITYIQVEKTGLYRNRLDYACGLPDVEQSFFVFSAAHIDGLALEARESLDPRSGLVMGHTGYRKSVKMQLWGPEESGLPEAARGKDFYFDNDGVLNPSRNRTARNGNFLILDVPEGLSYMQAFSDGNRTLSFWPIYTASSTINVYVQ